MKKTISIICLLMIILLNTIVYASTLSLDVSADKKSVEKDEEVIITVDWKDGMQAADFILNYDDKKFEFVESDIGEFCAAENSKVKVVWVSLDDSYKTSMTFKFKAINSGKCKFSVEIDGGFSNGEFIPNTDELQTPDNYNLGSTDVKVNGFSNQILVPIIIVVSIMVIGIVIKIIKKK